MALLSDKFRGIIGKFEHFLSGWYQLVPVEKKAERDNVVLIGILD